MHYTYMHAYIHTDTHVYLHVHVTKHTFVWCMFLCLYVCMHLHAEGSPSELCWPLKEWSQFSFAWVITTFQLPRFNQGTAGARILRSPAKIDTRLASLGLSRSRGWQFSACFFDSFKAARLPVGFPMLEYPRLKIEKAMGWILNQRSGGNMIQFHAKPNCSKWRVLSIMFQLRTGSPKLANWCPNLFTDAAVLFAQFACVITWHAYPRASRHFVTITATNHKNDAVHLVHPYQHEDNAVVSTQPYQSSGPHGHSTLDGVDSQSTPLRARFQHECRPWSRHLGDHRASSMQWSVLSRLGLVDWRLTTVPLIFFL